jgi:hypothetical protein
MEWGRASNSGGVWKLEETHIGGLEIKIGTQTPRLW